MIKNIYYIKEFGSEEARNTFQAQIESIFDRNGFLPLFYPRANYLRRFFFLVKLFFTIPRGAVIFFIHPLHSKTNRIVLKWLSSKGCKAVCIVSDINSLRFKQSLAAEIRYWKKIKYFIFQNEKMKKMVTENVGEKISVNIELFDLLFDIPATERKNSSQVVFAGNIHKCPFINDLYKVGSIQWTVLSDTPAKEYANVTAVVVKDLENSQPLTGSYGLVWEGDSMLDIANFSGQYLKWVSPLKLSNYLLNGLPVITHTDAAMAEFVMENKIGFCVNSLFGIEEKVKAISAMEYKTMRENVRSFSEKISRGYYTQRAVDGILEMMKPA